MGDIVNLRMARKRRERTANSEAADAKRVIHGRTKTEKAATLAEQQAELRRLDGHLRTTKQPGDDQ